MYKVTILLNDFGKIKRFPNVMSKFESDVDLVRDRYVIDAKSAMGLFTLDLSKPLDVVIHTDDMEEMERFKKAMEEFV